MEVADLLTTDIADLTNSIKCHESSDNDDVVNYIAKNISNVIKSRHECSLRS